MELSFVAKALRARLWMIVVGACIGLLFGIVVQSGQSEMYESVGQLNVLPPSSVGALSNVSASQLDRYVLTQLSILQSDSTAKTVAKKVGGGMSADGVIASTTIEQEPNSDIVTITARATTPKKAQTIAQAYVDQYLANSAAVLKEQQQPEIDRLQGYIDATQKSLTDIDAQIAAAMKPYLDRVSATAPVPDVSSIIPAAATQKQLLIGEYARLTAAKGQFEYSSQVRANSLAIQDATLPTDPAGSRLGLAIPIGIVAGALLGMLAAVLAMSFSDNVLSESSVASALKVAVAAVVPRDRNQSRHPENALNEMLPALAKSIDQLCVRAASQSDGPMRIAVAGTQRGSGSTSLALAMAARYSHAGYSVVVADIDARDQFITGHYSKPSDLRISTVVKDLEEGRRSKRDLSATPDDNIKVMGWGLSSTHPTMLRNEVLDSVIETAESSCDIVILDMGPVLESATIRHVVEVVDSVVLTVPLARQTTTELRAVRRVLADVSERLLPVITSPSRRPAASETTTLDVPETKGSGDKAA